MVWMHGKALKCFTTQAKIKNGQNAEVMHFVRFLMGRAVQMLNTAHWLFYIKIIVVHCVILSCFRTKMLA